MKSGEQGDDSPRDERFYTPRAQALSARSCGSNSSCYGTPRCDTSSISGSECERVVAHNNSFVSSTSQYCTNFESGIGADVVKDDQRARARLAQILNNRDDAFQKKYNQRPPKYIAKYQPPFRGKNLDPYSEGNINVSEVLSLARHNRCVDLEEYLSRGIVSADLHDSNGNSILAVGCQNGNRRVVKVALRYGADINFKNLKGNTALHFCYK